MAKRIFAWSGSFAASAIGSAAGASNTGYMAVKGGSATQIVDFLEFMVSGMASASTLGGFICRYSSTLGATPTALALPGTDGPMNSAATALVAGSTVVSYFVATTAPTVSNVVTLPTLQLGQNSFGGIIRWNAAPFQQWTTVGNAVGGGETVLFNATNYQGATTLANAHIIYEPT